MNLAERKLAVIHWVDSSGMEGWQHLEHIKEGWEELSVTSVGFVIDENDQAVLIVPHIAGHGPGRGEQGRGDLTIPRCAIQDMVYLNDGETC